jgi:hypothetical protein
MYVFESTSLLFEYWDLFCGSVILGLRGPPSLVLADAMIQRFPRHIAWWKVGGARRGFESVLERLQATVNRTAPILVVMMRSRLLPDEEC